MIGACADTAAGVQNQAAGGDVGFRVTGVVAVNDVTGGVQGHIAAAGSQSLDGDIVAGRVTDVTASGGSAGSVLGHDDVAGGEKVDTARASGYSDGVILVDGIGAGQADAPAAAGDRGAQSDDRAGALGFHKDIAGCDNITGVHFRNYAAARCRRRLEDKGSETGKIAQVVRDYSGDAQRVNPVYVKADCVQRNIVRFGDESSASAAGGRKCRYGCFYVIGAEADTAAGAQNQAAHGNVGFRVANNRVAVDNVTCGIQGSISGNTAQGLDGNIVAGRVADVAACGGGAGNTLGHDDVAAGKKVNTAGAAGYSDGVVLVDGIDTVQADVTAVAGHRGAQSN